MGEVYKALDDSARERVVAVKVLGARLAGNRHARRRFRREIETTARIEHPHVVDILDWGEWEGRLWFSMEYLAGRHLGHWIRGYGGLELDEKLAIAERLASALEEAHRHGVIHRDLKPANVMVHRADGRLSVKLLDFGIVHVDHSEITTPNSQPGTYSYMSPEQLRSDPMDHRSDLFSLGIVLFELFTGGHPFRAATDPLITHRILHEDPDPVEPGTLDSGIESLLSRMLEKRADDRPSSAAAIGRTFHGLRLELATVLPEDDPGYRSLDSVTREKVEQLEALARLRSGEGDLGGAIEAYRTVRELAPESRRILSRLEKLEHRRLAAEKLQRYLAESRDALDGGDLRLARERCEQAWVLDPQSEQVDTLRKWIALRAKEESQTEQRALERALRAVQDRMDEGGFDAALDALGELAERFPSQTLVRFLEARAMHLAEHPEIDYPSYRRALKEAEAELEADYLESALRAIERARDHWPQDEEWQAVEARVLERRRLEGERLFQRCRRELSELDGALDTAVDEEIDARLDVAAADLDRLERLGHDAKLCGDLRREAAQLRAELERRKARRLDRETLAEATAARRLDTGRTGIAEAQRLERRGPESWERALETYREARAAFVDVCRVRSGHAEAERSREVVERSIRRLEARLDEARRRRVEIEERLEECRTQLEEARRLSLDGSTVPALARRLLDDAALSLKRILELDGDRLEAHELRDRVEALDASLKRRADRIARVASAVREGLGIGRAELAVAKRLVVPADAETLERGQSAAREARDAYRRVLAVNADEEEALRSMDEVESLLDHYRSEIRRFRAERERGGRVVELERASRRRIDGWIRVAERTLSDARREARGDADAVRASRAYCAEVDVALQHVLCIEPEHDEARRLDRAREALLAELSRELGSSGDPVARTRAPNTTRRLGISIHAVVMTAAGVVAGIVLWWWLGGGA